MNSFTEFGQASRMIESFQKIILRKRQYDGDCIKKTNALIGTIGLNNLQLWSKRSEIGYDLHPRYWGMVMRQKQPGKLFIMDFKI